MGNFLGILRLAISSWALGPFPDVTIEDVPEEPGGNQIAAATMDGSLLEPVTPTPKMDEVPKVLLPQDSGETEEPPLCRIQTN